MIQTQTLTYNDQDTRLSGFITWDNTHTTKKPVVLVVHDWSGQNEFARKKSEQLAELGYIGFAIDMYGDGKNGQNDDEKMALMKPLVNDRALLLRRLRAAVTAAKTLEGADHHRMAAIGFCFGGLCVLDLARGSQDVQGVVSLHGLLMPPPAIQPRITTKVLVLHGHDDPSVPPDQVLALEKELTKAQADWQVMVFGGTVHAFTNPLAKDPDLGRLYNPVSAHRAWNATQQFLADLFSQ